MTSRLVLGSLLLFAVSTPLMGQHAGDIELGYDNLANPSAIVVTPTEFTCDGLQFFESDFEELDPFNPGDFSSDEPGYTGNPGAGMLVNSGDRIWVEALDARLHSQFGVGFVNYFNPSTGQLEADGRVAVIDNSSSTPNLILDGDEIVSGPELQFVDVANGIGDIHDHIVIDLLDDSTAPAGAYGVMFQLKADFSPGDGETDVESEPFWIIWNYGMLSNDFELSLAAFGGPGAITAVTPENSSVIHGTHVSGGTAELAESDNLDFSASRRTTDISSRVTIEVEATSPTENPVAIQYEFEGSVFARTTVVQSLDIWNYDSGEWEEVDSRDASRFIDASVSLSLAGDLTRFIEPGTGKMLSRVRFVSNNPRQRFTANVDRIGFMVEK